MTRRTVGVAVLCAALLCSVLLGRAGGVRVSGSAVLPPGLDAPSVGACLGSMAGPVLATAAEAPAAGPSSPVAIDSVGEAAVTFTHCAGDHIGEVVAFRRMPAQPADVPGPAVPSTPISDGAWCQQVASDYRSNRIYWYRSASGGLWLPATGQRFAVILGTPTADPTAPPWAACAIVSPALESYRGSYMSSLAENPTPAPFGSCRSGDRADRWVSCIAPHGSQVFGTAAGQSMSAPEADDACRSLISAMTGMTDISAGGVLGVVVIGVPADPALSSTGGAATSATVPSCRLSIGGAGRLVGTLIGIGRRPLPVG